MYVLVQGGSILFSPSASLSLACEAWILASAKPAGTLRREDAAQGQPPLCHALQLSCSRGVFPARLLDKVLQAQTLPNSTVPLMVPGCHAGLKPHGAVQAFGDTWLLNSWMSSVNFTNIHRQLRNSGRWGVSESVTLNLGTQSNSRDLCFSVKFRNLKYQKKIKIKKFLLCLTSSSQKFECEWAISELQVTTN